MAIRYVWTLSPEKYSYYFYFYLSTSTFSLFICISSKKGRFTWEVSGDDVPTSPALWRNSSVPLVADGGAGHYCVILARDKEEGLVIKHR